MITIHNLSYIHPNKDLLFSNVQLVVNSKQKIALIGNNGVGKSTLLKIIAEEILPSTGQISVDANVYHIPQIYGQYNHVTVAEALRVHKKINALQEILNGNATDKYLDILNDDWTIEDRCKEALEYWDLLSLDLNQKIGSLSGGQKTKVFLAGLTIHKPSVILLDEPSNHLDIDSRSKLYKFIQSSQSTMVIVSHDRTLLNLLDTVCELSAKGINVYGGNYAFYSDQKAHELDTLNQNLKNKERAFKQAREKERETVERQQKLDNRGKQKQEKAGVARIMMNTLRNKAENSTSKLKTVHTEKIDSLSKELNTLRSSLPDTDQMRFGFDNSGLHKGKTLFTANDVNYTYQEKSVWPDVLNFKIVSGEKILLKGANGSGKTTLIRMIFGHIKPTEGTVNKGSFSSIYIDQDYSLINDNLNVYQQAQRYNMSSLQEHEIKTRLNRFLFDKHDWDKPCSVLSGGEKMRLLLCCLNIQNIAPDMIVLDEPTNNLDIRNVEILTSAIKEYQGTLIVVSHDQSFLNEIDLERIISL